MSQAASHNMSHGVGIARPGGFDQKLAIVIFVWPPVGKYNHDADGILLIQRRHVVALDSLGGGY